MNLFKNWQIKKSKKKMIRKFDLLREVVNSLIEKIVLSKIVFYNWATYNDISKHIKISLYVPEGIRDGI